MKALMISQFGGKVNYQIIEVKCDPNEDFGEIYKLLGADAIDSHKDAFVTFLFDEDEADREDSEALILPWFQVKGNVIVFSNSPDGSKMVDFDNPEVIHVLQETGANEYPAALGS